MTQRIDFIDISHYQSDIDWALVAEHPTLLGVIHKATEGTSWTDQDFAKNREAALAAGLAFASYHYLHPGDADLQMAHYLEVVQPEMGERVVIDYEEPDPCVDLGDLKDAVDYLRKHRPDLQITIYGASMLTEHCVNEDSSFLEGTSLWAARFSSTNQPVIASPPWTTWSAWQFTDEGRIQGIAGDVDLNTFNGSQEACLDWFGPVPEFVPMPEPIAVPDIVIQTWLPTAAPSV